jgi:hemoglobin-like flavoprotein
MSLSPLQKRLIRRSFGAVAAQPDIAGQLFYARLFSLNPALRDLFKHDMNEQVNKFMRMIALCVSYLDDEALFVSTVEELGVRHISYGTRDEHYAIVGEALIWALSEGLGSLWTPEVRTAWIALYNMMAEVAIRGAHMSPENPPSSEGLADQDAV